jgi:hypothetical protein
MPNHQLHDLEFVAVTSERWDSLPDMATLKPQLAMSALARCELTGDAFGFYSPPDEIREVYLTSAAADQIRCMWHGHRPSEKNAPPAIPLKVFVTGFGQSGGRTWASIEVHPGMNDWTAI